MIDLGCLLFRVASGLCALPLAHVVETMRPLPLTPLLGGPEFVTGESVIRGAPVPVVDLARLLGHASSEPRRLVSVRCGERHVALAVEEVLGVARFAQAAFAALPPLVSLLRGTGRLSLVDDELVLLLDAARLVPETLAATALEARGA